MKKIIAIIGLLIGIKAYSTTIMIPGQNTWVTYRNVTHWTVKANGILEFYYEDRLYISSVFVIKD